MSTVEITLTGLFLVVPTGGDFTILLPKSMAHPHRSPTVNNESIEGVDIDLTRELSRGTANIPPRSTVPIRTASGNRPVKTHLLSSSFPSNDLKARIRIPKPNNINRIGNALWDMEGTPIFASNALEFVYDGGPSTITVPTAAGQKVINATGDVIRVSFVHRATVEPGCGARAGAHHVDAYYDLIDTPLKRPIPELLDACPAAFAVLALSENMLGGLREGFIDLRQAYAAAIRDLGDSMSTFTCLVGSGT